MSNAGDSVLDKAESLARRILERLGSNIDKKLAPPEEQSLSSSQIGDLASRLERLVDSSLKEDERGTRRIAPNRLKVLFTYEETSVLSPQYIEAVGKELTATLYEYINNRRYETHGPIEVTAERDLFAKSTTVRALFDGDPISNPNKEGTQAAPASREEDVRKASFITADGRNYTVELRTQGAPAYIGRAAGNAIRIDDDNVSRLHCSLSLRSGGAVMIADVGSANGTYVNEQQLGKDEARLLKPGDVIAVGDCKLTVSVIE
jgi:pSer/pThr/pTyr-binding forkhead associated (FHA) protein